MVCKTVLIAFKSYDCFLFRIQRWNDIENKISSTFWNLGDGYDIKAPLDAYPKRALGAGAKSGLFIVLRTYNWDLDYYCRGPVQGFKVASLVYALSVILKTHFD